MFENFHNETLKQEKVGGGGTEKDPEGSGVQERLPKASFNTSESVRSVGQGMATLLGWKEVKNPSL